MRSASSSATPISGSSCAPGEAVIYPSDTLHEVEPVTKGERLVAISFIQSRIPDPFRRNLLFNLNEVAALEGLKMSRENFTRLQLDAGATASILGREALNRAQAAFCRCLRPSSSAICTAFSAAPLRRLSLTTQRERPFSTVGSSRIRQTKVA